uniref:(+)-neomenthol dehydrogenase n=1 Tax=Kalanchoe fedtschenkoi TaxID=63787 RepID=A0A7N1A1X4_KALFE
MAEDSSNNFLATKRYAVVTGGNKGIGFEICKQLASRGVVVLLTARDELRGLDAVEKLRACGLSEFVVFHQLDVGNSASVAAAADFIRTKFGKLDILVNNAAIGGVNFNSEAFMRAVELVGGWPHGPLVDWNELATQDYEMTKECLNINYYGTKRMVEALIPLLQLSDSSRIVNVSSISGLLEGIQNEWAKGVLSNAECITEEKVDQVLEKFLQDFKDGLLEANGWPTEISAYTLSKVAMNSYTRLVAKTYPFILVNCVCPGYSRTDIVLNTGRLTAEEGAAGPVSLALQPKDAPSGLFYIEGKISSF